MSLAWATITRRVMWPLMSSPRMSSARARALSGSSASLTPPALPRPPVFTWALTTTGALISRAIASACSGVSATPPGSTGTPCAANRSRAWYSKRSTSSHRSPPAPGPPEGLTRQGRVIRPFRWAARSGPLISPHVLPHPRHDLLGARPRGEHLRDPHPGQLRTVGVRDDPATEDDDVVHLALAQQLGEPGEQRHVGTGEDRQPDRVGVLLDDGLHDLLRRLVQPGVDDLHAGVPERAGDHLRPTVVPVEAGFGDDHADPFGCHVRTLGRRCGPGHRPDVTPLRDGGPASARPAASVRR